MDFNKYKVKKEYPVRMEIHKCFTCNAFIQPKTDRFCSSCGAPVSERIEQIKSEYKERCDAYYKEESRLRELFWKDAMESNGFSPDTTHVIIPIDVIKHIAWENGHSAGFSEVYSELCDLLENAEPLIRP